MQSRAGVHRSGMHRPREASSHRRIVQELSNPVPRTPSLTSEYFPNPPSPPWVQAKGVVACGGGGEGPISDEGTDSLVFFVDYSMPLRSTERHFYEGEIMYL
jgi:hypothetical protein